MKILPVNNNVFIKQDITEESTTASGLIINPLTGQEIMGRGTVVAIAPWTTKLLKEEQGFELEEGDKVIFSLFACEDVQIVNEDGTKEPHIKKMHVSSLSAIVKDD